MPSPRRVALNARLLLQSALQHAVDDPALLVVQVSRRLPFVVRVRAGRALRAIASAVPGGRGAAALGAFMAGDVKDAQNRLAADPHSRSTMHAEVSVLLDRPELLSSVAPVMTRARSAWSRGEMREALEILDAAGRGSSAYARRLRSELQLLRPGYRLTAPPAPFLATAPPREGEQIGRAHV